MVDKELNFRRAAESAAASMRESASDLTELAVAANSRGDAALNRELVLIAERLDFSARLLTLEANGSDRTGRRLATWIAQHAGKAALAVVAAAGIGLVGQLGVHTADALVNQLNVANHQIESCARTEQTELSKEIAELTDQLAALRLDASAYTTQPAYSEQPALGPSDATIDELEALIGAMERQRSAWGSATEGITWDATGTTWDGASQSVDSTRVTSDSTSAVPERLTDG